MLEGDHPPVYCFPLEDVADGALVPAENPKQTFCEWKGMASYCDVVGADGAPSTAGS